MKKILPIAIIGILILSGCGAVATHYTKNQPVTQTMSVTFSPYQIKEAKNNYGEIQIKEATNELLAPGKPVLPMMVKHIELEFGVKNIQIQVQPLQTTEYTIAMEILPSPGAVSTNMVNSNDITQKDEKVYNSNDFYPNQWLSCHVACGLNQNDEHVTHVPIHIYPVQYSPGQNKIIVAEELQITLTYEPPNNPITFGDEYDLVIITPELFQSQLNRKFVPFKIDHGVRTFIKITEEIYDEYEGRDKPEQIKHFIKDAVENMGVKYVLLIGGLKNYYNNNDRDNCNEGSTDWYVPVRYSNNYIMGEDNSSTDFEGDPGFVSDLYYADLYKEGGEFECWDPNGDNVFAADGKPGCQTDKLDLIPDVYIGRLPCRNKFEVRTMINKIINYEKSPADPSWFNKVLLITGDSFQDQDDLNVEWDTNGLPEGTYTIYAQSTNPDGVSGPIDVINVTVDHSQASLINFTEDDHLRVDSYPADPIAEITSPSEGNILGNTNVEFVPPEAYNGGAWATVEYKNGIMHIRGKSYDPKPYGNLTDISVWIKNSNGDTVFSEDLTDIESWFEGEWSAGDKIRFNRTGVMGYMPDTFEKIPIWTSNGNYTHMKDVLRAWNKGSGFIYISMHASPVLWSQHNPGIPGGRSNAAIRALSILNLGDSPKFPVIRLANFNKLPILVGGLGCHHSEFNVSIYKTITKYSPCHGYWTYGNPAPRCINWWITCQPKRGAIATIGNTGTGYAWLGGRTLAHGSGYFAPEFFRLYAEEENMDHLGNPFAHAITNYIIDHGIEYRQHVKMMEEWTLLGDPSLMIGGYE